MFKSKKNFRILAASLCVALLGSFASAKKSDEPIKEEAGFYYGYGKGSTKDEAIVAAKKNLIEKALTEKARSTNSRAPRVSVSKEIAASRLASLKPFVDDKTGLSVTFRIKNEDWEKDELAYSANLRTSVASRYEALSSKKLAEKLNESVDILSILAANGEADILTVTPGGNDLFSKKIESICADAVKELEFKLSVEDGIVGPNTKFVVSVADASGNAVAGLNVKAYWETPNLLGRDDFEVQDVTSIVKTDKSGNALVSFPEAAEFHNKAVTLTVSTAFSASPEATTAMKKLDNASSVDGNYVHYDDFASTFKSASVPAGEFKAGAVSHDKSAGKSEASHKAKTGAYAIDLAPVTNAQYAAFLHATRSETKPDFFDNSNFNLPDQPVVGVSVADAEAYAQWLSSHTGSVYRLPTEEEWEKAARGGKETIYPWGDEDPAKSKKANCKKNGKFKFTSPVGSFENANGFGLVDMSGNVWEWTSSKRDSEQNIVKGGSWMDGPKELRISNFKKVDGKSSTNEIGFRLVKEISE